MTNTTQKIGAAIVAGALISGMALTAATHASHTDTIDTNLDTMHMVEISDAEIAALEKEFADISDAEWTAIETEFAEITDFTEEEIAAMEKEAKLREQADAVITENDWNTLSMKDIDDKLVAAGLEKIGDEENDPYYTKTVAEIDAIYENMTDDEWATIEAECDALFDDVE